MLSETRRLHEEYMRSNRARAAAAVLISTALLIAGCSSVFGGKLSSPKAAFNHASELFADNDWEGLCAMSLSGDEVLDTESDRHESCLEFYSNLDGEPSESDLENAGQPEEIADAFYGDVVRFPLGTDPGTRSLKFTKSDDGNWYIPLPSLDGDALRLIAPESALFGS